MAARSTATTTTRTRRPANSDLCLCADRCFPITLMLTEPKEMATNGRSKGIVSWPADERPRERLLSRGPHALTEAELLAILLRIGASGKSAIELGRQLLKQFGSLQAMMSAPLDAWQGSKGLGAAKIAQLQAAFELARR